MAWSATVRGPCGGIGAAGAGYLVINQQVLDRQTGRLRWQLSGSSGLGASMGTVGDLAPVADGPTVVDVGHGLIQGRKPSDGRIVWTHRESWINRSAFVGPATVVATRTAPPGASEVQVTAWNRATGRREWSRRIPIGSISLTRRALLVVESEVSRVQVFDLGDGSPRWWSWMRAGLHDEVGVGSGVAVIRGPAGIEARDDGSGAMLWSRPDLELFRVQPDSGVAMVSALDHHDVQLIDLRSGAVRMTLDATGADVFPLSKERVVRVDADGWSGVNTTGKMMWSLSRPPQGPDTDTYIVGHDLVTIRDSCLR